MNAKKLLRDAITMNLNIYKIVKGHRDRVRERKTTQRNSHQYENEIEKFKFSKRKEVSQNFVVEQYFFVTMIVSSAMTFFKQLHNGEGDVYARLFNVQCFRQQLLMITK